MDPKLTQLRKLMDEKHDVRAYADRLDRIERVINLMLADEPATEAPGETVAPVDPKPAV